MLIVTSGFESGLAVWRDLVVLDIFGWISCVVERERDRERERVRERERGNCKQIEMLRKIF